MLKHKFNVKISIHTDNLIVCLTSLSFVIKLKQQQNNIIKIYHLILYNIYTIIHLYDRYKYIMLYIYVICIIFNDLLYLKKNMFKTILKKQSKLSF